MCLLPISKLQSKGKYLWSYPWIRLQSLTYCEKGRNSTGERGNNKLWTRSLHASPQRKYFAILTQHFQPSSILMPLNLPLWLDFSAAFPPSLSLESLPSMNSTTQTQNANSLQWFTHWKNKAYSYSVGFLWK